jgi:hypothetical protein
MDFICPTCGEKITRELLVVISHTEKHIIDTIKKSHPNWIESDGTCKKCHKYYKEEMTFRS